MSQSVQQLRLILGDQLNPQHSWFAHVQPEVMYVLMEVRCETDYVLHHAQKILAIFAAMRDFAKTLKAAGHRVHYITIDDPHNQHDIVANMTALAQRKGAQSMAYQMPDEYRLDQQLASDFAALAAQGMTIECVEGEHFLTARDSVAKLFTGKKQWLMERFYRQMRQQYGVLMEGKQPIGGQWNFDHDNRKTWTGQPPIPSLLFAIHDHQALWQTIVGAGVKSFGQPQAERCRWPLNRAEALQQLDTFIQRVLPYFGDFQDAMTVKDWRLFHSLLSFALNVKMLHPREVIEAAEQAWRAGHAPLAAVEGFIRQILGWREYVRGVYWAQMPDYRERNVFAHDRALPSWFWTGQVRMNCLRHAIGQSLEYAYAHHIQRLMVIGNFALLAGLAPKAVHEWYLGVYIDAFEWVELPNTLGMSQFADGGLLATKPYVSSAAYIGRMSDYCQGCPYNPKEKLGAKACPMNSLYWDFFARHRSILGNNPRLGIVYKQLDKMDQNSLSKLQEQAVQWRERIEQI